MPIYKEYTNSFTLRHGTIGIYFRYIADYLGNYEFNFDVLEMSELEHGYEDDDLLTFSPNILRIGILDYDKKNYGYLKQVLQSAPYYNYEDVAYFEFYYAKTGGQANKVFAGYIDKTSLNYDEEKRVTSFEVIDFAKNLRDITCKVMTGSWENLLYLIAKIYEEVYPNFVQNSYVTDNIDVYKSNYFKGIYWKHNWKFRSNFGAIQDFGNINSYNKFAFMFDPYFYNSAQGEFPFDTMADLLKALAIEFGLVIGTEAPYKVYAVKRFVRRINVESIAVDVSEYIIGKFTKSIWLKNIICTVNNNVATGWRVVYGYDRQNPNRLNVPANRETHYEISTRLGCYKNINNISFTTMQIYSDERNRWEPVFEGVKDVDVMTNYAPPQHVICALYQASREVIHDKYEFELFGVDFSMADYYKLDNHILRPLVLKKDYIKNRTTTTALEITINR